MLRKACDSLRKEGVRVFTHKATRKLLGLLFGYGTLLVFERDLRKKITHYPIKADIRISLLSPSELHLLNDRLGYDETDLINAPSWLAQGDKCFVGYVRNKISTYVWVSLKERRLAGNYRLPLGKNKAFFFKGFTIPSMRGLGLIPAVLNAAYTWLQENGYSVVYSDTNAKNIRSIRTQQRMGLRIVGTYRILRILKWRRPILPPQLRKTIGT